MKKKHIYIDIYRYFFFYIYLYLCLSNAVLSESLFYDDLIYLCVSVLLIHYAQEFTANNESLEYDQNASHIFCMCLFIIFPITVEM